MNPGQLALGRASGAHCACMPRTADPKTFVLPWTVTTTDVVLDVLRALGEHRSASDVFTYGRDVLEIEWSYVDVLTEMQCLMEEGRLGGSVAA